MPLNLVLAAAMLAATTPAGSAAVSTTAAFDFESVPLPAHLTLSGPPEHARFTREAAISCALAANPAFQAARARLDAARGEYRRRSAAPNLHLGVGAVLAPHPDGTTTRSMIADTDNTYLRYTFPTSGRRRSSTDAGSARYASAQAELDAAVLDVVRSTAAAYVDVQIAQAALRVNEDAYRIAVSFVSLARRQVDAGAVPESNAMRAAIEQGRVEQDLVRAQADLLVREEALAFAMGRPAGQRTSATGRSSERAALPELAALIALAVERRPEVRRAAAECRALAAETEVARSERRPDITLKSAFTSRLTNTGNPPVQATLELPLFDRGAVSGEVARLRAERLAAERMLAATRREVGLEVTRAVRQVEAARRVLDVSVDQLLPRTRTLLERARIGYAAGAGTLQDVLDAQRVYRQTALDREQAGGELDRAVIALERAIGGPLPAPPALSPSCPAAAASPSSRAASSAREGSSSE